MAVTPVGRTLAQRARAYGCHSLIPLDTATPGPEHLQYLDLLPRRSPNPPRVPISAVVEDQGVALLYLVDGDAQQPAAVVAGNLAALQHQLANRSDPAWIGLVRPGSLDIYPIGFHATGKRPIEVVNANSLDAPLFFQSLVHGTFDRNGSSVDDVYNRIFEMLTRTVDAFVPPAPKGGPRTKHRPAPVLDPLDVLSLAGRALFFRFLIDRAIVLPEEGADICPNADDLKDAFSNATKAAATSAWLDETFNGDFLRLIDENIPLENREARRRAYRTFYLDVGSRTDGAIFKHMQAILRGWKHVDGQAFQLRLDWDDLNFAHIPIGVLSQVYESFSHRADPKAAQSQSVHYTPRVIARLLVDQVFAAAPRPVDAVVLDPACGAGIFLALAFRRLVQERWKDKGRPTAAAIRQILYKQIRGFDVSEPALRLAALTLYITAIELNASPRPPATLKFPRSLRDEVLFHFGENQRESEEADPECARRSFVLGSLSDPVRARFENQFDIVIGNPPWTRLRDEERELLEEGGDDRPASASSNLLNAEFTKIGAQALRDGDLPDLAEDAAAYKNPDKNPDLPFLWRATHWAKVDGLVAMVLHARIFQRTTEPEAGVWRAVMRRTSVTGLINFADLRKTAVWDGVDVPYCLLFLCNARPPADHRFYYTVPAFEPVQNKLGRFRIDYASTRPLSVERVARDPWILKTLSLGTWLDVEIMARIREAFPKTLKQVWVQSDPEQMKSGKGYSVAPKCKQLPADFLAVLPDFVRPAQGFSIDFAQLKTFFERYGRKTAYRPTQEALYQPPLVVVPQSPGDDSNRARAYVSNQPLAYSQSFYGYSCAGHPEQDTLSALLYLLPHSKLFAYFCLMTSRRVGFDRQTFNKEEFDALPFPMVSALDPVTKSTIRRLARELQCDAHKPWKEIDRLLFRLYGLDDDAIQIARDTLFASLSYRQKGRKALEPPRKTVERLAFRAEIHAALEPYFDICGQHVAVEEPALSQDEWRTPWFFLAICVRGEAVAIEPDILDKAMEAADARASSLIVVHARGGRGLVLGVLSQRRWWTRTRARLCAQYVIRDHLNAFGFSEGT